jgi:hypothetical protein
MSTPINPSANHASGATSPESAPATPTTGIQSIVTHRDIAASVEQVWSNLQFYEELDHTAPFLLRLLLPRPERKVTAPAVEGHATSFPYDGGHYARRITKLEPPMRYEFEVVDQRLTSDRGVMLLSGAFTLHAMSATQTDLAITTRYVSRIRPRWLANPLEALLCRRLHRHLLDAIEAKLRNG